MPALFMKATSHSWEADGVVHRSRDVVVMVDHIVPVPESRLPAPVAEKPAAWVEQCSSSSSKQWSPRALTFYEPTLKDGAKVVVCLSEEVAHVAKNWDNVLMGYFISLKPYVPALAKFFKHLWMVKGELQVLSRGNGFPLFKFTEASDKLQALEDGPWFVQGKPLVLRSWSIHSIFEKDKLLTIPVWIKLPNLPLCF